MQEKIDVEICMRDGAYKLPAYKTELHKKEDHDMRVKSLRSNEVGPAFELKVELYSCNIEEDTTLVNTPKKLAKKFSNSFGRASGRKLCPLLDAGDPILSCSPAQYPYMCAVVKAQSFPWSRLVVRKNDRC
ncbi:unnamed protein product [Coregonus sp. 'balchen']|nr:unnamed protein product [Coregonus sp. 'balchen']